MRSVPLWIGTSDDAPIPPRVKLRIWEREGGRCWITGRKIMPGDAYDFDHKVALCNGGRHSEDNLAPVLRDKHREKTRADVRQKSIAARKRKRHLGVKERRYRSLPGSRASGIRKRMNGTVERW